MGSASTTYFKWFYFSFRGRTGRQAYWIFMVLPSVLLGVALGIINFIAPIPPRAIFDSISSVGTSFDLVRRSYFCEATARYRAKRLVDDPLLHSLLQYYCYDCPRSDSRSNWAQFLWRGPSST